MSSRLSSGFRENDGSLKGTNEAQVVIPGLDLINPPSTAEKSSEEPPPSTSQQPSNTEPEAASSSSAPSISLAKMKKEPVDTIQHEDTTEPGSSTSQGVQSPAEENTPLLDIKPDKAKLQWEMAAEQKAHSSASVDSGAVDSKMNIQKIHKTTSVDCDPKKAERELRRQREMEVRHIRDASAYVPTPIINSKDPKDHPPIPTTPAVVEKSIPLKVVVKEEPKDLEELRFDNSDSDDEVITIRKKKRMEDGRETPTPTPTNVPEKGVETTSLKMMKMEPAEVEVELPIEEDKNAQVVIPGLDLINPPATLEKSLEERPPSTSQQTSYTEPEAASSSSAPSISLAKVKKEQSLTPENTLLLDIKSDRTKIKREMAELSLECPSDSNEAVIEIKRKKRVDEEGGQLLLDENAVISNWGKLPVELKFNIIRFLDFYTIRCLSYCSQDDYKLVINAPIRLIALRVREYRNLYSPYFTDYEDRESANVMLTIQNEDKTIQNLHHFFFKRHFGAECAWVDSRTDIETESRIRMEGCDFIAEAHKFAKFLLQRSFRNIEHLSMELVDGAPAGYAVESLKNCRSMTLKCRHQRFVNFWLDKAGHNLSFLRIGVGPFMEPFSMNESAMKFVNNLDTLIILRLTLIDDAQFLSLNAKYIEIESDQITGMGVNQFIHKWINGKLRKDFQLIWITSNKKIDKNDVLNNLSYSRWTSDFVRLTGRFGENWLARVQAFGLDRGVKHVYQLIRNDGSGEESTLDIGQNRIVFARTGRREHNGDEIQTVYSLPRADLDHFESQYL